MGEWTVCTVGQLCDAGAAELQTGPFGSQLHAFDYVSDGVPVVPTEAIRARRIDRQVLPRISLAKAAELRRHRLLPGDILFARRGVQATGQTAYVQQDEEGYLCGTGAIRLRLRAPYNHVLPEFLSHVFISRDSVDWLKFHAIGATMPNLNEGIVRAFPVVLPPLSVQAEIGALLGALDDKIELNRRMNETLEAMARAIFKDWFVDFGPTRAKMEGREPYLAPDLWTLFPDRLDDEGKPEGWHRDRIGEHVIARKGLSYNGRGLTEEGLGLPLHNLNSVREGGGYKTDGLKFYRGEYKSGHIARAGDLVVANTEQGFDHLLIGFSALTPAWTGPEALFTHHLFKVEPRSPSPLTPTWLHFALSSSPTGSVVRRFSNGTTVNMLPADAFVLPSIIVPPLTPIVSFEAVVAPMLKQQEQAYLESRTLAQTRDLLLPKLMSGEIRVKEAEKLAEAVA